MKFLIVGRTASGKDTLRSILEDMYGWIFVTSYATRPRRTPNEKTHTFITPDQAKAVPEEEKAAKTRIGEFEYFATKTQVMFADGYIIDPVGVKELLGNMPEVDFFIVYLVPDGSDAQMKMAVQRAKDESAEARIFKKRNAAEDGQFSAFEAAVAGGLVGNVRNVVGLLPTKNDYDMETLLGLAEKLNRIKQV